MRTLKRIISALLVLSLLAVSLCSCDLLTKPGDLITVAEAALALQSYKVEHTVSYESGDAKMQEAISAFTAPTILTEVDGESFRITMAFEKDGRENGVIYTYVDGVLYTVLDELGVTTKTSESVSGLDSSTLAGGAGVSADDFATVKAKSSDGTGVITCTDIKDEALARLVDSLADQLDPETVVAIKNATLDINLKNGMYDTTVLKCDYVITTSDAVYTVTMTYESKFTYGNVDEIVAPVF